MPTLILVIHGRHLAAGATVQLAGDRIGHIAELLLLFLEIFRASFAGVFLQPVSGLFDGFQKLIDVSVVPEIEADRICLQSPCHLRQSCHQALPRHWLGSSS